MTSRESINKGIRSIIAPRLEQIGFGPIRKSAWKYRRPDSPEARIELSTVRDRLTGDMIFGGRVELVVRGLEPVVRAVLGDLSPPGDWNWSALAFLCELPRKGGKPHFDDWTAPDEGALLSKLPQFGAQIAIRLPPVLHICESMQSFSTLSDRNTINRIGLAQSAFLAAHICVACAESGKHEDALNVVQCMHSSENGIQRVLEQYVKRMFER